MYCSGVPLPKYSAYVIFIFLCSMLANFDWKNWNWMQWSTFSRASMHSLPLFLHTFLFNYICSISCNSISPQIPPDVYSHVWFTQGSCDLADLTPNGEAERKPRLQIGKLCEAVLNPQSPFSSVFNVIIYLILPQLRPPKAIQRSIAQSCVVVVGIPMCWPICPCIGHFNGFSFQQCS